MKSNSYRVILVSLLMIFSSLAGCLEGDDDTTEDVGSSNIFCGIIIAFQAPS